MTELKSHVPGSFCWPELVSTDQPGAVAFYRGLFGWEVDEADGSGRDLLNIPNVGRFAMLGDPVDAGFAVFTRAGK